MRWFLSSIGLLTTPVSDASLLPSLSWLPRTPVRLLPCGPVAAMPLLRCADWSRTVRRTLEEVMALVRGPAWLLTWEGASDTPAATQTKVTRDVCMSGSVSVRQQALHDSVACDAAYAAGGMLGCARKAAALPTLCRVELQ